MKNRLTLLIAGGIAALLVIIAVATLWSTYNSLVTKNQAVDGQWAQVETQYQRRFDLIPNLVNSVKGAMTQEQAVFSQIAEARTHYADATTPDQKAVAGGEVESALSRLLVVMENYPQLKSIDTVTTLMDEISGTENRISVERGRYNTMVKDYNTTIAKFPTNMMAGMFNFTPREYFKSVSGSDAAPTVQF